MSRRIVILICTIILHFSLRGQNLIPNPDFETYGICPNDTGKIFQLTDLLLSNWHSATDGIADYFNSCDGLTFDSVVSVPSNMYAEFQPARSGNGYVGLTIISDKINHREYIQTQLLDTLIAGEFYYFEAWLATAMQELDIIGNTSYFFSSDDIGVYFSNNRITDFAEIDTLGVDAHINNVTGNYITNPGTWHKMNGYYPAHGGEQWITIGNFKPDASTDTIAIPTEFCPCISHWKSYFFIDDVSLTHAPQQFLQDTLICEFDTLIWEINIGDGDYLWSTGDTTNTIHTTEAGWYWLQYTDGLQIFTDSAFVSKHIDSTFTSSLDTSICNDELPIILYSPATYETYSWSNGDTTSSAVITTSGTTILTSRLHCNTYIDSFNIITPSLPSDSILFFDFNDTLICEENFTFILTAPPGMENYIWSNGDTTQSTTITTPGTYSVHYVITCFYFIDYVTIFEDPYLNASINLGEDIDLCAAENFTVALNAGVLPNYNWSTGEITQQIVVQDTGTYIVSSTTACATISDTIIISDCRLFSDELILFPNPSLGIVTISSENELLLNSTHLEVLSIQGKVWETNFDFHNSVTFNFSTYPKGYYLIRMISGNSVYYFDMVLE